MGKGYHPPPTDGFTDVLRWFLVAVPDKAEYVRAAMGAYTDLAKQWKWDETVGSAQDAEDSFDEAIAATLEALEMGFPDTLLGYIDEVEALLESLQYIGGCCNANDASDGTLYTDDVSDGVGTVPQNIVDAGFAASTSDWAGFDDYKCMIAHVIVYSMEGKLRKFGPLIDASGTVIGGIAAIIGIITTIWSSGLTALAGAILASSSATATLYKNLSDQASTLSLADDVAANHDALACAFYDGTDGPDAAVAALKAEIDNLFGPIDAIILKNLNIEPEARALYAGRYDQQNIAQTIADKGYNPASFDCTCAAEASKLFTFDASVENWIGYDSYGSQYTATPALEVNTGTTITQCRIVESDLAAALGLTTPVTVDYVDLTFDVYWPTQTQSQEGRIQLEVLGSTYQTWNTADLTEDTLNALTATNLPTGVLLDPGTGGNIAAINIKFIRDSGGPQGMKAALDNVSIGVDTV